MRYLREFAVIVTVATAFAANAQSRDPVPVETTHGTRAAPAPAAGTVQAKDGADVEFLLDALSGSLAEARLGELAQQRSQSSAVRDYAKRLQSDHATAVQEIKGILGTLNVTMPDEPTYDAQNREAALAKLSGPAFEAAFLKVAIESHEQALAQYGAQTRANPNEPLALFAAKALPMLEEHLVAAKSLQSRSGRDPG
jgi:putative membrane protein